MSTPIDISELAGVRYLHFGSEWVQGAMRIRRPYALELAYTREMMAGLLLRDPDDWPKTALVIGLGAASITRFLHHHCPKTRIQVVEIEPFVVQAAQLYFRLPEADARLAIYIGDGAQYILQTDRHFDYILVDGYDRHARAGALDTAPFYQAARARLTERGLLSVNLFGRSRGYKASVGRVIDAFDDRAIAFPSCDSGNVVAFGAEGERIEVPVSELRERAIALKARTGLDLGPTVTRLEQAGSLPGGKLIL
jgi:spermidine synthase